METWIPNKRGWLFLACAGFLFFFNFCGFFPWLTRLPGISDNVDSSWFLSLQWAYLHHLDFGHEIAYTFGPWGFSQHGYLPQTFGVAIASCALLSITFSASLLFLGLRSGIGKWWTLAWSVFVSALVITWYTDAAPMVLGIFLLMASLGSESGGNRWMEILLALTLGFFSLSKFPMFVLAIGIIFVTSLNMVMRRKIPWAGIVYTLSVAVFWLAAGQKLGSFLPFLRHSFEISSGYAQGEGIASHSETMDLLEFLICALGLFASFAWVVFSNRPDRTRPIRQGTLFMWGLIWVLVMTFKTGYIRHDAHAYGASVLLAATALTGLVVFWNKAGNFRKRLALAGVLAACLGLSWLSDEQFLDEGLPRSLGRSFADFFHEADLAIGWLYGSSDSDAEYRTAIRVLTSPHPPVADTQSTVDVYPSNIRAILGAGMNYDPRPIMQSLLAYTPALAEMNAEFLRSTKAPEMILFDVDPIDDHLPSEEDSFSWPEILTRYDLANSSPQFVILKRSPRPRSYSLSDLGDTTATWGQSIPVPESSDPIWMTIQLDSTIAGKIVQAAIRPPPLRMKLMLADESQKGFRLIPAIADSGFLLSPAILNRESFARMFSDDWQQSLAGSLVKNFAYFSRWQQSGLGVRRSLHNSLLRTQHHSLKNRTQLSAL